MTDQLNKLQDKAKQMNMRINSVMSYIQIDRESRFKKKPIIIKKKPATKREAYLLYKNRPAVKKTS